MTPTCPILFALVALSLYANASPLPSPTSDSCGNIHTAVAGESCWSISQRYGLALSQLNQLNPYLNCFPLAVSQRICVSSPKPTRPQRALVDTSTNICTSVLVQPGDTCTSLAATHSITVADIDRFNLSKSWRFTGCNSLQAGQVICVSEGNAPSPKPNPQLQCGIESVGNKTCAIGCCSAWGWCGFSDEHCKADPAGIPGIGCQSNCRGSTRSRRMEDPVVPTEAPRRPVPVPTAGPAPTHSQAPRPVQPLPTSAPSIPRPTPPAVPIPAPPASSLVPQPDPVPRPPGNCNSGAMRYSVGYYESWAETRSCMAVPVEKIDTRAFTHLHYSFAILDANLNLVLPSANDEPQLSRFVQHVHAAKKKAVIAVGGAAFNEPGPTQSRFTNMLDSAASRAAFIQSAKAFLSRFHLDGIDLDYEYPSSPEKGGRPQDAQNYLLLVREMKQAWGSRFSVSMAAPTTSWYLQGYKYGEMAQALDYVVSMTYDLTGTWDFASSGAMAPHTNIAAVRTAVEYAMQLGVPAHKFVLGLAYYGRSFKQADRACDKVGCKMANPASGTAEPGRCTQASGILAYWEIKELVANKAHRRQFADDASWTSVLTYGQDSWIAYDTPETIRKRVDMAQDKCLGGVAVWAINQDSSEWELSAAIAQARGV